MNREKDIYIIERITILPNDKDTILLLIRTQTLFYNL